MTTSSSIVWFYRDLRLADNVALSKAAAVGSVLPLYILEADSPDGAASKWWLHEALCTLSRDLQKKKTSLVLKRGDPLKVLLKLIDETGASSVTWARRYEPSLARRDAVIEAELKARGVEVIIQPGYLLFEPEKIATKAGTPFKVYTPFSKACRASASPGELLPAPKSLKSLTSRSSDSLASLKLVPSQALWPKGLRAAWDVGEAAAMTHLRQFLDEGMGEYKTLRNRPDIKGTSRMSPYLHFGHISPRTLWHAAVQKQDRAPENSASAERYLLEILWREFSWHLLHHFKDLATAPLQKSFEALPWRRDKPGLTAWQKGLTGYPIVDAGMRQLWQTGWMHNRVRMIVASFLVKDLLIDWRLGIAWFWDTLVDADAANNSASWQWVAGCGADAAPYYRVFNPTLQGFKFDPKGLYIRTYIPELAKLPDAVIHEPVSATPDQLAKAGLKLGKTYPLPIVDHKEARLRALQALKSTKGPTKLAPKLSKRPRKP